MQKQVRTIVDVLIDVIDPFGRKRAATANQSVHLIAFFQKQLGQVTAVLAGDSRDQGGFGHDNGFQRKGSSKRFTRCEVRPRWLPPKRLRTPTPGPVGDRRGVSSPASAIDRRSCV